MKENRKIFIQIASYRDPELVSTIKHCLERAKYPENLKFSIVWQHSNEDVWDNLDEFKNDERFTINDIDYKNSKGACWARNIGQQSWVDEEFSLQIDSHMRFIENWDEEVIKIWESLEDKMAIITGYPPTYTPEQDEKYWGTDPQICNVNRFNHKYIYCKPSYMENWRTKSVPPRGVYISAGFIFGPGEINKTVPYDPDFYFSGEECAMALRYFTNGYNIHNSHKVIVHHYYERLNQSKHWGDDRNWVNYNKIAHDRLDSLLCRNNIDLGIYSLGTKRTLKDYEIYAGVDFEKLIVHKDTEKGIEPPCSNSEIGWDNELTDFSRKIKWDYESITKCDDVRFWAMIILDQNGISIYRFDLPYNEYKDTIDGKITSKQFTFAHSKNRQTPTKLLIWPYSESTGWLQSTTQDIEYEN